MKTPPDIRAFQGTCRRRHIFMQYYTLPEYCHILVCMAPQECRSSRLPASTCPRDWLSLQASVPLSSSPHSHHPTLSCCKHFHPSFSFFFENDDTRHKEITIPDIIAKLESILGVLFLGWVENGTEFLVVIAASQNNQEALK